MSKSLVCTYQFDVLDDGRLLFYSRYYAQRFIDEYLIHRYPVRDFVIDREEDGFVISWKLDLVLDKYSEPMVKYM